MRRVLNGRLTALACIVVAIIVAAVPAEAHESFTAASPGPGDRVGGTIDRIVLVFTERVDPSDAHIRVFGSDGTEIAPTADLDIVDGAAMRQRIEPIAEPGEYRIEYRALSADDGLAIDAAYLFTYDPEARAPVAIPLPDEGGLDPVILTGTIGTVVLAGVIGVVASRRRHARTSPRPVGASPTQ